MLTISKPLSAGQAQRYHREEFQNARENYYTEGDRIVGAWHGRLAEQWGLHGEVREDHFARLADGRDPMTDELLVRHQTPHASTNSRGERVQTMEHRAGWDATFSAPKSVSLTALVAGDDRVREAHRESVGVALGELEAYTQARLGGNLTPETTGNWIAATFEHDSARPVDGYPAPQLHTHVVIFNTTRCENGDIRPVQPRELYKSQQFAVYRSELASRLTRLGYEIERGPSGQPEIRGYSREYLDASSPRRQQITDHLERGGYHGARAAEIAAHQTRDAKGNCSRDDVQDRHRELAAAYGNQPALVREVAHEREWSREREDSGNDRVASTTRAHDAVTYAKAHNLEREAVVEERDVLCDALVRSMGGATIREVRDDLESRVDAREFLPVERDEHQPGRTFTTPEMIALERETIERMHAGQHREVPLVRDETREDIAREHGHLNDGQRDAIEHILTSHDQILGLDGRAGVGKTTTLTAIGDAAEREGYCVEGLAPTSRATHALENAGISARTLQAHLERGNDGTSGERHLYVLDESSLVSTRQMHDFLERLDPQDRVLLVGDTRQHQAVEAGRPFEQLRESGLDVARLDTIVRQREPELREVVEHLSRGEVREAIDRLDDAGRVHEIPDRDARMDAIARDYADNPRDTLVVSPDNASRSRLNEIIHRTLQECGDVDREERPTRVLVPRQDLTGADRQWAGRYEEGDVIRYTKGSRTLDVQPGEYARVECVQERENLLTVRRDDDQELTYDPRRLQGVAVYREKERALSVGDRVQFTAPDRERRVANRELGTIDRIDDGRVHVRLDSGRDVAVADREGARTHIDYGYAVTSHSSQGQTAERVLVHIDTERSTERLVNERMAYVSLSRGRDDARIYTDDRTQLAPALSRDRSHRSAIDAHREQVRPTCPIERVSLGDQATRVPSEATRDYDIGMSR
jgi:conjugative relaxase-like TrwC/TraI family protein